MNIDEAILHCKEVIDNEETCDECKKDHLQLIEYLKELKVLRSEKVRSESYGFVPQVMGGTSAWKILEYNKCFFAVQDIYKETKIVGYHVYRLYSDNKPEMQDIVNDLNSTYYKEGIKNGH